MSKELNFQYKIITMECLEKLKKMHKKKPIKGLYVYYQHLINGS
jgi:hypothetical protein